MQTFLPLTGSFEAAAATDWRALASRRGSDLDRLSSRSLDGLPIGPVYARGDGPVLAMRPPGGAWLVMERINIDDTSDLRGMVNGALHGGATGIEFTLGPEDATNRRILDGSVDLGRVLAWRSKLAARTSVQEAVTADYPALLTAFLQNRNSWISQLLDLRNRGRSLLVAH